MPEPHLLCFGDYDPWDIDAMSQDFELHWLSASHDPLDMSADERALIQAFAFKGHDPMSAEIMDAFPNLEIIANFGVGYDSIDVAHALSRGIKLSNTPDVLTDDVADLAVGMLLGLSRDIPGASHWVTSGQWGQEGAYPLQRTVSGQKVGIVGLGRIGRAIAERMVPFQSELHYYARSAKDTPGWTYHDSPATLAAHVDILVVAVSANPETAGIVSREVLDALGPDGVLVNISRGITVDEEGLISALQHKRIRGAALDVFYSEPNIDERFLELDNVLLQPHQSSATVETRKKMGQLQRDNLHAHFAGTPLLTPVTG